MKASRNCLAVGACLHDETGGDVCIATGMFSVDRNELLLRTRTHRTQRRWYRPTEVMTWAVMRRAAVAGATPST